MQQTEQPQQPAGAERIRHPSLYHAVLATMREVGYVQRTRAIGVPRAPDWPFVSESSLIAALRPAMIRHGIVGPIPISATVLDSLTTGKENNCCLVRIKRQFKFVHVDSGEEQVVEVLGEAADTFDKAVAKAMTLAKKYALREFFCIETGDDPDWIAEAEDSDTRDLLKRICTAFASAKNSRDVSLYWSQVEKYAAQGKLTGDQLEHCKLERDRRLSQLARSDGNAAASAPR